MTEDPAAAVYARARAAALRRQRWLLQMLLLAQRDVDEDRAGGTGAGSWPRLVRLARSYGGAGPAQTEPDDEWARGAPALMSEFEAIGQLTIAELFGREERVHVEGDRL